ncbi:MAG: DUF4340 domain-containing protein [Planctomycetaceae bacterium]|nr:DUF4340 domain-containing protein [Planctomycetales bacterium]MCB9921167.1 DUF4340 domain-containing protein [Planctomycetaceae bacterium]
MNEATKTAVFAGVAVLVGCVWLIARPTDQGEGRDFQAVGRVLFEKLDDPTLASSLEILRYNEDLGEIHEFKVAKNGKTGLWSIPSHSDYPADAETRIRDVATSLVGLKVLGVVTEDKSEHELFGVEEPDKSSTKLGDKGVGLLVSFEDQKGKKLASLIIGKPIKGADGHHFVREPGRDLVYDVEIDPDRFSTKFEDWIKQDLLDLAAIDVERMKVKDYSVLRTTRGFQIEPKFDLIADWNSNDNKWELNEFLTYKNANGPDSLKPITSELLPGEELNGTKLNDLKNALAGLKIADVRRKPSGLGADLKAEAGFLNDQESVNSLVGRGFYPLSISGGDPEILSANGDLHAYMKDGYEYVLRFGNVAGTEEDSEENKLNRYLMVTAAINDAKFPMPELEVVPKKPASADVPPPPSTDAPANPSDADADTAKEEEKPEESNDGEEEESSLDKEIKRIEKENQRKLDEWKDKRGKAEEKVRELNARFADWYYVVAEDEYKKIRLTRSDLIKEGEKAADEGFGVDAFRKLQDEGLKKPDADE